MQIKAGMIEVHIYRVIDNAIEFLILRRADKEVYGGIWQMVTGGVEDGEKAWEAALREVREETGLEPEKLWVAPQVNSFYSPRSDTISLIPVFLVKAGPEAAVSISAEHSAHRWVAAEEAKRLFAWPGQRQAVDTIVAYLTREKSFFEYVEIPIGKDER